MFTESHDQPPKQQFSALGVKTYPVPDISQQTDTIIESHDQPPKHQVSALGDKTFPVPDISQQRDTMIESYEQHPKHQICGQDDKAPVGKNQRGCDLSNTDVYGDNFSDCDADVESSGGECLGIIVPFGQQNMMGSQASMATGNLNSSGTPGTNENSLKRKNQNSSSKYELHSQKKSKIEHSTQGADSYQVLNLSTQFQEDVMSLLRERCQWLGLNEEVYNNMSGMSLLTIIVM